MGRGTQKQDAILRTDHDDDMTDLCVCTLHDGFMERGVLPLAVLCMS